MTGHQYSCAGLLCLHLSGCCPVKPVLDPASSLGFEQVGRRLDSGLKLTSPSPKEPLANSAIADCAIPIQSLGAVSHNNCECPILSCQHSQQHTHNDFGISRLGFLVWSELTDLCTLLPVWPCTPPVAGRLCLPTLT